MLAREYFDSLRFSVLQLAKMEDRMSALDESAKAPKSMGREPSSGGSRSQPIADRLIDMEREVDEAKARLTPELDRACNVLYGKSGRGGVAAERGYAAADAVHGYYLQAMSWPEVASELVRPESDDGVQWCKRAAYRALECIDRIGMARLADS